MKNKLYALSGLMIALTFVCLLQSCLTIVRFLAPETAETGEMITAEITVKSDLTVAPGEPIVWHLFISPDPYLDPQDEKLSTVITYAGIASGTFLNLSSSFSIPSDIPGGQYYLVSAINESTVDNPSALRIYDEAQNVFHRSIQINPSGSIAEPDLVISHVLLGGFNDQYYRLRTFYPDGGLRVWATVENRGGASSASANISYYLSDDPELSSDDQLLISSVLPSIAVGAREEVFRSITLPVPPNFGHQYLVAVVNEQQTTTEYNSDNNLAYRRIRLIERRADHQVAALNAPGLALAGSPLSISGTLGGVWGGTTSEVGVYLSSDTELGPDDQFLSSFSAVTAFEHNFTLPSDISTGAYYLIAHANDQQAIPEYVLNNNTQAIRVFVIGNNFNESPCETIASELAFSGSDPATKSGDRLWPRKEQAMRISIFPNPASEYVQLNMSLQEKVEHVQIELLDSRGSVLRYISVPQPGVGEFQQTIHVAAFPAGSYQLRISDGEQLETQTIILQK